MSHLDMLSTITADPEIGRFVSTESSRPRLRLPTPAIGDGVSQEEQVHLASFGDLDELFMPPDEVRVLSPGPGDFGGGHIGPLYRPWGHGRVCCLRGGGKGREQNAKQDAIKKWFHWCRSLYSSAFVAKSDLQARICFGNLEPYQRDGKRTRTE